jgi:hypothetical protein
VWLVAGLRSPLERRLRLFIAPGVPWP